MKKFNSIFLLTWLLWSIYPAIACDESAHKLLESNVQKWKNAAWGQYSFVLERQCFCALEYRKATQVFVENGNVVRANFVEEEGGGPVPSKVLADLATIEDWFEVIRYAYERKADLVDVVYDPELGFPNKIEIDMRTRRADDEQSVIISNVLQISR